MTFRHAARLLCALGVALVFSVPRLSQAQDDATIEMARQRFREGVQFYDAHQYEKARLAFLQAYAIKPHPSVLLNLAQSELRSSHPDDAAAHFSQYLRASTNLTDAERQETTAGFNTAKSKVAEVAVTVDPSGSQITVDGVDKGVAPLADPLYLTPGSHTIEARAGERHASKIVTLGAGQSVSIQLAARGSMAAAGAPTAAETPATEPAAEEPEAAQPSGPVEPPPEKTPPRELEETPPAPGGTTEGIVEWFARKPAAWVFAGVGVVGLGLGGTMALVANHDFDNANIVERRILDAWQTPHGDTGVVDSELKIGPGPCSLNDRGKTVLGTRYDSYVQDCNQYGSYKKSGDSERTIAIVSTAVGGAAIIGTVVYYFIDRRTGTAQAARPGFQATVVPWTATHGAGVGVMGSF